MRGTRASTRASQLVNRTIYFDREDVPLPEGVVYNDDLLGLPVFDTGGARLGSLTAVEEGVRGYHYVVTGGEKSYRIPAVDEFVKSVSLEDGVVVALIDGLEL